mmetsp:Transcript_102021/g.292739  ORF Transcript_102021/g.292739 Transcript_102021/m.292739 type:complete len:332 (-) Transcript_102021:116-1111(-)
MLDQGTQVMLGCASTTTSLEEVSEQQRPSPRRAHACGLAAAQARQQDREQILEAGVRLALGRGQPPQLPHQGVTQPPPVVLGQGGRLARRDCICALGRRRRPQLLWRGNHKVHELPEKSQGGLFKLIDVLQVFTCHPREADQQSAQQDPPFSAAQQVRNEGWAEDVHKPRGGPRRLGDLLVRMLDSALLCRRRNGGDHAALLDAACWCSDAHATAKPRGQPADEPVDIRGEARTRAAAAGLRGRGRIGGRRRRRHGGETRGEALELEELLEGTFGGELQAPQHPSAFCCGGTLLLGGPPPLHSIERGWCRDVCPRMPAGGVGAGSEPRVGF